jgi:UDP-N-acetylmuramoyl-tripeptide--D-alanyl-D-alanine ligase
MIQNLLDILTSFLFIAVIFQSDLFLIYLWQLKEYRFDRFKAHLKTNQGKRLLFSPQNFIKVALLAGLISLFYISFQGLVLLFIVFLFYLFSFLYTFIIFPKRIQLPVFTIKTVLLMLIIIITILFIMLFISMPKPIMLLILDIFGGLLISFYVSVFAIPSVIIKKIIIIAATLKINNLKRLKTIGITGSYGKTSAKDFLASILSVRYRIVKTDLSQNTEIAVALKILRNVNSNTELFIVEMGAYKKGEIEAIARMVRPDIGIITGINEQHAELFGGIKNTAKAKYELINNLKKNGIAILNTDSQHLKDVLIGNKSIRSDLSYWGFGYETPKERELPISQNCYLKISKAKSFMDHISFSFKFHDYETELNSSLCGIQNVSNIAAAYLVAKLLGLNNETVKKSVKHLQAPENTMRRAGLIKETVIVDDAFNANPDGVKGAIDYMKDFSGKKVLVLTPLIELGCESGIIHRELGKLAGAVCDKVLLTNINFNKDFLEGVRQSTHDESKVQIVNTLLGKKIIEKYYSKNGVIIFEGKESAKLLKLCLNDAYA